MTWWGYDSVTWMWMVPTMVIIWGIAIAIAVFVIDSIYARRFNKDAPIEKLRRRLAAGEITQDEYDHIMKLLVG